MKNRLRFSFLIVSFFAISCSKKQIERDLNPVIYQSVYNEFKPLWKLYQEDSKEGWLNNDQGRFSNDAATVIEGLVYLYKKTNDEVYLNHSFEVSDRIISNDDITRGVVDYYRGNAVLPGWSSTRYTFDNSRHIFDLDDALILYPIVRLYTVINESNDDYIKAKYKQKASILLNRAVTEFDKVLIKDWVQFSNNSGFFYDPYFKEIKVNMPLNQLSIVGQLCLDLYIATKEEKYKRYALQTATYLKNQLRINDGSYQWNYNLPYDLTEKGFYELDDIGHGSWVTYFAVNCFEQNLVFNKNDVDCFIKMFDKINKGSNSFAYYVNGSGISEQPLVVQYYILAPYKLEIKNTLDSYYFNRKLTFVPDSVLNHIGYHHILYFGMKVFNQKKI